MRFASGKNPIVSAVGPHPIADMYLDRLPNAIRFWLDPRLLDRIDVDEIAAEIEEALTTRSRRWRTDESVSVNSLREMALNVFKRIQNDYLGPLDVEHAPMLMRLAELPPADPTQLAYRLMGSRKRAKFDRYSARLRMQEAFNSLSPHHREILVMRHFEQLSAAEIAEATQLKPSDVVYRYRRAMARLKAKLHQEKA